MKKSTKYTVRPFRYSTTLTQILFYFFCIPVWASCLCPAIINVLKVHNYSNVFLNFQCSVSKCFVSWYVWRSFCPVTAIVCSVVSSSVAGSLRKQTVLPENTCRGNCTKTLFCLCAVNANYWVFINQVERRATHTVTHLPSISESVVELSIMLFSLIYNVLSLDVCVCVCVFYVLMQAFVYAIVSQMNFRTASFGIPQEMLEWVHTNFENFKFPDTFKNPSKNRKIPLIVSLQYKLTYVF